MFLSVLLYFPKPYAFGSPYRPFYQISESLFFLKFSSKKKKSKLPKTLNFKEVCPFWSNVQWIKFPEKYNLVSFKVVYLHASRHLQTHKRLIPRKTVKNQDGFLWNIGSKIKQINGKTISHTTFSSKYRCVLSMLQVTFNRKKFSSIFLSRI